ncbi:hypothetical protein RhiirA4_442159 [Rhizophagus irregularis]|uniref:RING-type domain-containing protein n=1 Tax=Rhizophagus irregularis TaxID=588596 RepID=A0A2I1G7X5_9GLOM|nr:hypothetical protein RhiirA4_442159 [Rhizophagus irregularis]
MYIEFLHCNACFTYPSSSKENQIRFWLTECGHVVCKSCLNKHGEASHDSSNVTEHTCPVCNTRCAAVELTDNLPPNLGAFFRTTYDILDEAADVMRFQKTNTISLIEFLKHKLHKQRQMLDKAKNEILQYKDMKNELQNLKEENRHLKSQLQEVRPNTSSTSVKRPIESPIKLNNSPLKLHKSPTQNRDLDISPSQTCQPKTPNPPKRLTLSTSINSPMRPLIFKQQSQQKYDNYSSQLEHQNNNGLPYSNQISWNYGVGNYDGYDGISDRRDARAMPSPSNKCYSVSFSESNCDQYPRKISNRPGTASSTRMTWSELRNSNRIARHDVLRIDSGSRALSAASASKYQNPSPSNYTISTNFRPSLPMSRNFIVPQPQPPQPSQPPRTPIIRNRDALPGINNRGW